MDYNTYPPCPDLSAFVKCYWTLDAPAETEPGKQRIVPDGCMEMIFHYGDHYLQYFNDGSHIIQPRCFVFGQLTQPLEIEPTGLTGIFAVRFHPDGFNPFATLPITNMENRAAPLRELYGEKGIEMEKAILSAKDNEQRLKLIEPFLFNLLSTQESVDRVIRSGIDALMSVTGQLTVEKLSEQLNINRRQLERKFSSAVGLSPKQLAKIIRMQSTLKKLASKEFSSLTEVAYEGNYYDQAHFIKDFKEFTGLSPKKFFASDLKLSALFSTT